MKIGILGGTFNPIHNMHIKLAKAAMESLELDKVIFITAAIPPHKSECSGASSMQRHSMVELAIKGHPHFEASTMEIERGGKSYTYLTLCELKNLYPNDTIYFIIGGDSLMYLDTWHQADKLMKMCIFAVYPRENDCGKRLADECERLHNVYGAEFALVNSEIKNISSTDIRNRLHEGKDLTGLVSNDVYEYIKKNNLYNANAERK